MPGHRLGGLSCQRLPCLNGRLQNTPFLFGVRGTNLLGVQRVLSHVQLFSCFSIRLTVYLLWSSAESTCLGLCILFELEQTWQDVYSLNPAVWDTSSSEDFVGRVSRQFRRIGYGNIVSNTLLVDRIKMRLLVRRFKKLRRQ